MIATTTATDLTPETVAAAKITLALNLTHAAYDRLDAARGRYFQTDPATRDERLARLARDYRVCRDAYLVRCQVARAAGLYR